MSTFFEQVFSWVCAQNTAHTWGPGGEFLPLCQRCTGFYAGAAIALVLMVWLRPRVDARYRWIHTVLVVAMTPFGFHLVPHGAIVRTLSGQWFGFGVVGLLWLFPGRTLFGSGGRGNNSRLHLILGLLSLILVPVFACWGGAFAGGVLPWIAFLGLIALAGLLAANIAILFSWILGCVRTRMGRQTT